MAYEDVFRSIKVKDNLFVGGSISGPGMSNTPNSVWYVDGNKSASNGGASWGGAFITIQEAVDAASPGDVVYIAPIDMAAGATDPGSYAEKIIIPATAAGISLVGITGANRTQGGLPQIKAGGSTAGALLTIQAPGCLITGLGFNGNSTAGAPLLVGILLDDDNSTKTCIGTTISNCHFKNCAGSTVTDCRTGGAITWSAKGGAWQTSILNNRFYKNVCDVCLIGTSETVPQDVLIQGNIFSGPTASVDTNLYLAGGSGMNGVIVDGNNFGPIGTLGSAVVKRLISATACVGIFSNNVCQCTGLTFGAAGTGGLVPTTMMIALNYQDNALIART